VGGWRRQEIGISGGGSLRRPRPTQGCSAEKKNLPYSIDIFKIHKRIIRIIMNSRNRDL
jgi:hypothetical protein